MSSREESQNPDEQIQFAFKIIKTAFDNKVAGYDKEFHTLKETIKLKNNKISEYENTLEYLTQNLKKYEENFQKLLNENKYLSDINAKLIEENTKLNNFKNSIISSLENEDKISNPTNRNTNLLILEGKQMNANTITITGLASPSSAKGGNQNKNTEFLSPKSKNNDVDNLLNKLNSKLQNKNEEEFVKESVSNNFYQQGNANYFEDRISEIKKKFKEINSNNIPSTSYNFNYDTGIKNAPYDKIIKDDNFDIANNHKILENKSNQYILSSKFFNECKISLKKDKYDELIETLNNCKENKIEKQNTIIKVEEILKNYPRLVNDFKAIFPYFNK